MTDFLPLFPLKLVVFPGEQLNLHIFEPRYKQLIREVEQNATTFGIPPYVNEKVMPYGTEIKLLEIVEWYEDGAMDIRTEATGLFEITTFYRKVHNKLYSGGDINRLDFKEGKEDSMINDRILEQLTELFQLLKIKKPVPLNSDHFNLYDIAHHVGFSLEQEYEFLSIPNRGERQQFMLDHITKMIPVVREMERLKKRIQMNGHFKEYKPPEF